MTESKTESWRQGCRALFAGFVAASSSRQVKPNIANFWETEQKDIILPTLRSLATALSDSPDSPEIRRVLFDLLNSTNNSITRIKRQETDDLDSWEYVEWELTTMGQRMFPKVVFDVQPVKGQVQASSRWWDQ